MSIFYHHFLESHEQFWQEHPALLSAISLLISTSTSLFLPSGLWLLLWSLYLGLCKKTIQYALLIGGCLYGLSFQMPQTIPPHEITANFHPKSVSPHVSPFHEGIQMKGDLFYQGVCYPSTIYVRGKNEAPSTANFHYQLQGTLTQRAPYDYVFKAKNWKPISSSWKLTEFRHQMKESFKTFLQENIANTRSSQFLSAMTTGDVEDRLLRYEFGKVGLQHILAISGFHFAILITFATFVFRLFLSHKWKIFALFLCITAYFIFLGSSPAIERSYLTALLYLLSQWMRRNTSGLNLLGFALCVEIIAYPPVAIHLGFQLSFLSCFAILLFTPLVDRCLQTYFPKRSLHEQKQLPLVERKISSLSNFFRTSISLTFAVNLILLPLLLFHFHQFPLLGFLYNLFFPFCVGISLFGLCLSCIAYLLFTPLAAPLFWLTNIGTEFLLQMSTYPPLILSYTLRTNAVTIPWIIGPLFLLTFLAIPQYQKLRNQLL